MLALLRTYLGIKSGDLFKIRGENQKIFKDKMSLLEEKYSLTGKGYYLIFLNKPPINTVLHLYPILYFKINIAHSLKEHIIGKIISESCHFNRLQCGNIFIFET